MRPLWENTSIPELGARLLAVIVAITVHEFAHALVAYRAGDDTAKQAGRLSLNPVDHFDLIGSLMLLFVGFGWAKPVPTNPSRFRNYRRDSILVAAAGPISNLLVVTALGLLIRFGIADSFSRIGWMVLLSMIFMNLGLGFFNLIPIPPLDGSHILMGILPPEQARTYARTIGQYGFMILIVLLFTGAAGALIGPPISWFLRLVTGLSV